MENIRMNMLIYVFAVPTAPTHSSLIVESISVSTIPASMKKRISKKIGKNKDTRPLSFFSTWNLSYFILT